jgi:hypothetical protein
MPTSVAHISSQTGLSESEIEQAIQRGDLDAYDAAYSFHERDFQVHDAAAQEFIRENRPRRRGRFGGLFERFRASQKDEVVSSSDTYIESLAKIANGKCTDKQLLSLVTKSGRTANQIEQDAAHLKLRMEQQEQLDGHRRRHAEHKVARANLTTLKHSYQTAMQNVQEHYKELFAAAEQELRKNRSFDGEIRAAEKQLDAGCQDPYYSRVSLQDELREVEQRLRLLGNEMDSTCWISREEEFEHLIQSLEDEPEKLKWLLETKPLEAGDFALLSNYRRAKSELADAKFHAKKQNQQILERTQLETRKTELEQQLREVRQHRVEAMF